LQHADPSSLNWGVFFSNLVWNFGGFDFIGGIAAETEGICMFVCFCSCLFVLRKLEFWRI